MFKYFWRQRRNDDDAEQIAPTKTPPDGNVNESELQGVLAAVRGKLQADLLMLQPNVAGSCDILTGILANVTQHVGTVVSSLEKERELRVAVQVKLEETCQEMTFKLQETRETLKSDVQMELGDVLELFKSDAAGSLQDMSSILIDVAKQADNLEQAVKKEREQRTAVEANAAKIRAQQESKTMELRRDMKLLVNDFATLRMELAEHSRDRSKIEAAVGEANSALKEMLQQSHTTLLDALVSHIKYIDDKQNRMQNALQSMIDEHKDVSTKMLADVVQQLQIQEQAATADHKMCLAVEARMGKLSSELDIASFDLKQDLQAAMNASHATMKSELADCSQDDDRVLAAIREATPQNPLSGTHVKLQKSAGSDSLNGLVQQVSKLERSVQLIDNQMRLVWGANLDKLLSKQNESVGDFKTGLQAAADESLSKDGVAQHRKTIDSRPGSFSLVQPQMGSPRESAAPLRSARVISAEVMRTQPSMTGALIANNVFRVPVVSTGAALQSQIVSTRQGTGNPPAVSQGVTSSPDASSMSQKVSSRFIPIS